MGGRRMKSQGDSSLQGQGGRARKDLVQAQRGRGGSSFEAEELSRPWAGLTSAGETSGVRAWDPFSVTGDVFRFFRVFFYLKTS